MEYGTPAPSADHRDRRLVDGCSAARSNAGLRTNTIVPAGALHLHLAPLGVSMQRRITQINPFTVGWRTYSASADTPRPFEDLRALTRVALVAGR